MAGANVRAMLVTTTRLLISSGTAACPLLLPWLQPPQGLRLGQHLSVDRPKTTSALAATCSFVGVGRHCDLDVIALRFDLLNLRGVYLGRTADVADAVTMRTGWAADRIALFCPKHENRCRGSGGGG